MKELTLREALKRLTHADIEAHRARMVGDRLAESKQAMSDWRDEFGGIGELIDASAEAIFDGKVATSLALTGAALCFGALIRMLEVHELEHAT